MSGAAVVLLGAVVFAAYTYVGYPALLALFAARRSRRPPAEPARWPTITILVPAYNEERVISATLDSLLALDYPADRRQILVVSDASSDRTDEVVAGYRDRGVELLRMPQRGGKTAAENGARGHLRGEIVVNTDASVRIAPDAVKRLVVWFGDPAIGVASGRDVSVSRDDEAANAAESGYVGYEMWIRDLESRVAGIVGASGCFYAIRAPLYMTLVPEALSRDFAAALIARERGYRAVSVKEAVCFVPRTTSLRREYRRKVRTMARGMETLHDRRHLINPLRHGAFAWQLVTHKIFRWLVPWAGVVALAALAVLATRHAWAPWLAGLSVVVLGLAALAWWWPDGRPMPRAVSLSGFVVAGNVAALHATVKALRGERNPIWEPTRREGVGTAGS